MSYNTVVGNQSNLLIGIYDFAKIFLSNIQTEADNYINNSSYDPITLYAGTVMGRIGSTGILVPTTSTASDGSQKVQGVLMHDVVIAGGANVNALICVGGTVDAGSLLFVKPGDNLQTVVSNVQYRDKIQAETLIKLRYSTELSYADNY